MPRSIRLVGERGLLIVEDWKGRDLVGRLGLEEPTYHDGYKEGFTDGYEDGRRDAQRAEQRHKTAERPANKHSLEAAHSVYRKLVAKHHPDHDGGSEEVMKDINELWQAISKGPA